MVGNGTAAGHGGGSAAAVVAGPAQEAEAEAGEPEGPVPVVEELLLVPVSQLGLLTAGRKGSPMAVIARLSGATIVKEPKPKEEGEPSQQQQQEAEEEEEEIAGGKDEAKEEGQKGEERLVKVYVRSRVEAKMRAAVDALRAVLEGKVRLILGECRQRDGMCRLHCAKD